MTGDFYFRFKNVKKPGRQLKEDEATFERVIVDATIRILSIRGQPTHMPIISNGIEPALCEHGFPFSRDKTIEQVISDHVGKEFVVYDKDMNEVERPKKLSDKILWLVDPQKYLLDTVPLEERVEKSVVATLFRRRKTTFTEVMVNLYTLYKNALTPNPPSVKALLKEYATPSRGLWTVKHRVEERERDHSKMIALLAEVGRKSGYKIWVGLKEQSDTHEGKALSEWCDFRKLPVPETEYLKNIDVLWIKNKNIMHAFEIENTTAITEAFNRCSNIPEEHEAKKFIVIPEERKSLLYRKINSEMLRDRVEEERWRFIYYSALEEFYNRNKRKKSIHVDKFEEIARIPKLVAPPKQPSLVEYM